MIPLVALVSLGILAMLILYLLFYELIFLRDPERTIPAGENIVSPCDGRVIAITPFKGRHIGTVKKGAFGRIYVPLAKVGKEGIIISIFMSPFDVHVTRSPIAGKVLSVEHKKGKFLRAFDERALAENEKAEILIAGKRTILVILVAGVIARRIRAFIAKGDTLRKGERIGIITLGSQSTLVLPKGMTVLVKAGDHVTAGESVIAR